MPSSQSLYKNVCHGSSYRKVDEVLGRSFKTWPRGGEHLEEEGMLRELRVRRFGEEEGFRLELREGRGRESRKMNDMFGGEGGL